MPDIPKSPPPSLNEALIDRHFAIDPQSRSPIADPVLAELRDVMQAGRVAADKATRVSAALLRDEMQTLPARHRRAQAEAWRTVEGSLKRFDMALAVARREIEDVERRTFGPPKSNAAGDVIMAGEVRARLAAMPEADRRAALEAALAEGDDAVVGAALHGPSMLSGLSAPEHASLRDRWRRARHGPELERIDRLRKALDDTTRGGSLLLSYVATLTDRALIEKAEASEAAAREALAS